MTYQEHALYTKLVLLLNGCGKVQNGLINISVCAPKEMSFDRKKPNDKNKANGSSLFGDFDKYRNN